MLAPPSSMPLPGLEPSYYSLQGNSPISCFRPDASVTSTSYSVATYLRRPSPPSPSSTTSNATSNSKSSTAPPTPLRNRTRQGSLCRLQSHPPYSPSRGSDTHAEQRERFGTRKDAWVWSVMNDMMDASPMVDLTEGNEALIKSPNSIDVYKTKTTAAERSLAEPPQHVDSRRSSSTEGLSAIGLGILLAEGLARTVSNESSVTSMTSGSTSSQSSWGTTYRVTIQEEEDPDAPPRIQPAAYTDLVDPLALSPVSKDPPSRKSSVSAASFVYLTPSEHQGWEERDGWIQLGRAKGRDMEARMLLLSEERGTYRRASTAATMPMSPSGVSAPEQNCAKLPRKGHR